MDPNANLQEQLKLAKRFILMSENASDTVGYDEADVCRLSELVIALDEWIKSGGFLPTQWRPFHVLSVQGKEVK